VTVEVPVEVAMKVPREVPIEAPIEVARSSIKIIEYLYVQVDRIKTTGTIDRSNIKRIE
jgi:hypothetical protein